MATLPFKVVIPARYASSRLPAKPLLEIAGKAMVLHVVERALHSGAEQVVVATDHAEIAEVVRAHGHQAVMTREDHASGTERIAEVAQQLGWPTASLVVNVQGDEPLISPALISAVAHNLASHVDADMATACHTIHDKAAMFNPNVVKVVADRHGHAMYFSRAPIPYARDAFAAGEELPAEMLVYRHIGLYAYRVGFLHRYGELAPSALERYESLEQLRVLWHGERIAVHVSAEKPGPGVDTAEDLERVRRLIQG